MAWIESHQQMARHPKTLRLAGRLRINKAQAIGHLHLLWWWTLDYAPSGELSAYASCEIAAAAEWTGDAEGFLRALKETGWLDEGMRVHDWQDYAGKLLEERERDRLRKRAARAAERRRVSGECPADVREESGRTVPNRTEPTGREGAGASRHGEVRGVAEGEGALSPGGPGGEEWKAGLREHGAFVAAWRDWEAHVTEAGRGLTRLQREAVLLECARQGPERAAEVIGFSIRRGARNLIWDDAPRSRATRKAAKEPEPDPEGWAEWLAEQYPDRQDVRWADAPEGVQAEYRRGR